MSMTIGKRIICGFGASIVITAALGTFAFTRMSAVEAESKIIANDSLPGVYLSGQINSVLAENYGRALSHVIAEGPAEMEKIEAELAKWRGTTDTYMKEYEATISLPEDRRLFGQVAEMVQAYRGAVNEMLPLSRQLKTKRRWRSSTARSTPPTTSFPSRAPSSPTSIATTAGSPGSTS
jgi:hypothetical protein